MKSFMGRVRELAYSYHYISDEPLSVESATRLFDYVENASTHGEIYQTIKDFRKDYLRENGARLTIDEAYRLMKTKTVSDITTMYSYTN